MSYSTCSQVDTTSLASIGAGPAQCSGALPPNRRMELTGLKRHALCKEPRAKSKGHAAFVTQLMPNVRRHIDVFTRARASAISGRVAGKPDASCRQ